MGCRSKKKKKADKDGKDKAPRKKSSKKKGDGDKVRTFPTDHSCSEAIYSRCCSRHDVCRNLESCSCDISSCCLSHGRYFCVAFLEINFFEAKRGLLNYRFTKFLTHHKMSRYRSLCDSKSCMNVGNPNSLR